jgi:hypothetical protein
MGSPTLAATAFAHDEFWARKKFWTLFSPKFYFYDQQENLIAFVKQKAFKLREDIRVYRDEAMTNELLHIRARTILDWSTAYDVVDSYSRQKVGTLKRKGWKSMVRDEWVVMDANEVEIGRIREDSAFLALLRRFLTGLIPQDYSITVRGREIGSAKQNLNFLLPKMNVDLTGDPARELDRRIALAAVVLLMAVEGRQD